MEPLIAKLVTGSLTATDEKSLYRDHQRHFERRVRVLDASFFPGAEKSEAAIGSLGNGAYASFKSEPHHEKQPAFFYVHHKQLPAIGFLYQWRASATIQYLRREGPELVRDRFKVLRNLRIHLRSGFEVVGERGGQTVYAPKEWGARPLDPPAVDSLELDAQGLRGKALLRAVFEAARVPLSQSELAKILLRVAGVRAIAETELLSNGRAEPVSSPELDKHLLEDEVTRRTRKFLADLTDEERALLVARGHGSENPARKSFREVAKELGRLKEESYRLMERRILERIREAFPDREEVEIAVRVLVSELNPEFDRRREVG